MAPDQRIGWSRQRGYGRNTGPRRRLCWSGTGPQEDHRKKTSDAGHWVRFHAGADVHSTEFRMRPKANAASQLGQLSWTWPGAAWRPSSPVAAQSRTAIRSDLRSGGVRPAGIEPATKCLEGGRGAIGRQPTCRLTMASGTGAVRAEPVVTGPVVVAVVVKEALGLRARPHSCRAFRRRTAVKAARAANRWPALGLGLDRRSAAVRTIGRWEGLPGGEPRRYLREARAAGPRHEQQELEQQAQHREPRQRPIPRARTLTPRMPSNIAARVSMVL